jgi:hypothetical protein
MDPTFIPLLKQQVCSRVNNIRRRATPRRPAISLAEVEKLLTTLATLMKYGFQHRPPAKLHEADLYAHIRASILQLYEEKRINSPDLYGQWVVALLRRVRMNFRKKHPNNAEFCGEDEQFGSAEQLLKHHGASATPPPPQSAISSKKMLDIASALFATKDSRCMVICSVVLCLPMGCHSLSTQILLSHCCRSHRLHSYTQRPVPKAASVRPIRINRTRCTREQ